MAQKLAIRYIAYAALQWNEPQIAPYITNLSLIAEKAKKVMGAQKESTRLKATPRQPSMTHPEILMASLKVMLACLRDLLQAARAGLNDLGPNSRARVVIAIRKAFAVFMFALLGHRYTLHNIKNLI